MARATKIIVPPNGRLDSVSLAFPITRLQVDNYSDGWLTFPDLYLNVPPYRTGWSRVIPFMRSISVRFSSNPGVIADKGTGSFGQAFITFSDDAYIGDNPGQPYLVDNSNISPYVGELPNAHAIIPSPYFLRVSGETASMGHRLPLLFPYLGSYILYAVTFMLPADEWVAQKGALIVCEKAGIGLQPLEDKRLSFALSLEQPIINWTAPLGGYESLSGFLDLEIYSEAPYYNFWLALIGRLL